MATSSPAAVPPPAPSPRAAAQQPRLYSTVREDALRLRLAVICGADQLQVLPPASPANWDDPTSDHLIQCVAHAGHDAGELLPVPPGGEYPASATARLAATLHTSVETMVSADPRTIFPNSAVDRQLLRVAMGWREQAIQLARAVSEAAEELPALLAAAELEEPAPVPVPNPASAAALERAARRGDRYKKLAQDWQSTAEQRQAALTAAEADVAELRALAVGATIPGVEEPLSDDDVAAPPPRGSSRGRRAATTTRTRPLASELGTFSGAAAEWLPWRKDAERKMRVDGCLYEPATAIDYLLGRLAGPAKLWAAGVDADNLLAAARKAGRPRHTTDEAVALVLNEIAGSFSDPTDATKAAIAIRRCRQDATPLTEFLPEFEALARRAAFGPTEMARELVASLRPELRQALVVVFGDLSGVAYPDLRAAALSRDPSITTTRPKDARIPAVRARGATATTTAAAADMQAARPHRQTTGGEGVAARLELPATCTTHTNRATCPSAARGKLGPFGTAEREAKIALLRELGRCFRCRGEIPAGEPGHVSPASTPSPPPQ